MCQLKKKQIKKKNIKFSGAEYHATASLTSVVTTFWCPNDLVKIFNGFVSFSGIWSNS